MNRKRLFILAAFAVLATQQTYSSVARKDTPYQYYRDFAENRGIFQPGATGVQVKLKDGRVENINVPIPDLSSAASTKNFPGIVNLIQGQFTTTCAHNPGFYEGRLDRFGRDTTRGMNYLEKMTFGKGSTYQYKMVSEHDHPKFKVEDGMIGGEHRDFAVPRLNKLVTEVAPPKRFENFPEEYRKNPKRFTALARVGSGRQHIEKDGDRIASGPYKGEMKMIPQNQLDTAYTYLTGGLSPMQEMMIEPVNDQILIKENNQFRNRAPLGTTTTNGDSGSPIYVYDNQDKEWKWLGNVLGAYTNGQWRGQDLTQYDIYSEPHGYVSEIIDQYTVNINRTNPGQTYQWNSSGAYDYTLNGTQFGGKGDASQFRPEEKIRALDHGQNIVLTGGGNIQLNQNVDQGAGTITFKDNYIVSGANSNISWVGGGLDIAKDKKVVWKVKGVQGDSLHKIGEGELFVNGIGNNLGDISVGDGIVTLAQQNGQAFNNIEIVSGRGTVKLAGDNQIKDSNSISFGFRGGNLDLNGQDLEFKGGIKAYDIGANITNNQSKISNIVIAEKNDDYSGGDGGWFPGGDGGWFPDPWGDGSYGYSTYGIYYPGYDEEGISTSGNMVYHGKISNNINTTVESGSGKMLFDGEIDTPNGTLTAKKNVVLQGHPVIHAYTDRHSYVGGVDGIGREGTTIAEKLRNNFNDDSLLTKPVSTNQDDWEDRRFTLKNIDLKDGKELTVGRNAIVRTNSISAGNSNINLGSTTAIVDERDGDGLVQKLVEGNTNIKDMKDRAHFTGNIDGNGSKVNMNYAVVYSAINDANSNVDVKGNVDWTLLGDTHIKNLNVSGANNTINLSLHDGDKWSPNKLTTDTLNASNQTFGVTVYPKAGKGDEIVVNNQAMGGSNRLKLDFINPDPSGRDIRDEIVLASTPRNNTANGEHYFEAVSEAQGFSLYKPNVLTRENNNNIEWYLKKTDNSPLAQLNPMDKQTIAKLTEKPEEKIVIPPVVDPDPTDPIDPIDPTDPWGDGYDWGDGYPPYAMRSLFAYSPYMIASDNTSYIRDVKALLNTQEAIFINENELLTKRLGDIRGDKEGAGIWYKVEANQNDLDGVKLKGKTMELGIDKKINDTTVGVFGSYSEGKTSIDDGHNDYKYGGAGVYCTYATDNGVFIDLVGKYIRTSQEIKLPRAIVGGSYADIFKDTSKKHTDMFMGSAQTGFRKTSDSGFFIEPTVKITAGHMDGYKVVGRDGTTAEVKSSNPVYAETGVQVGKNFDKFGGRKVSVSAGAHYQKRLGNKGKIVLTDILRERKYDTMDTERVVTNVSVDGKVTDSLGVYGRVEKSFGGKYKTDYSVQVGFKYTF